MTLQEVIPSRHEYSSNTLYTKIAKMPRSPYLISSGRVATREELNSLKMFVVRAFWIPMSFNTAAILTISSFLVSELTHHLSLGVRRFAFSK